MGSGMWFLKVMANNRYSAIPIRFRAAARFRDLYFEAAPAGKCPPAFAYSANTDLNDKIALELACAASMETTDYQPGRMVDATSGMGQSVALLQACEALAGMSGSRQKAIGIGCLIAANDSNGVVLLQQHLSDIAIDDLNRIVAAPLLGMWRSADPVATASLGLIATSPGISPILTRSAATALSAIHTSVALPYLAQLLNNADPDIQVDGALGLSSFANGLPIHTAHNTANLNFLRPSGSASFRTPDTSQHLGVARNAPDTQRKEFISYWKTWWQANQQTLLK
jgi:hypothetical protein